MWRDTRLRSSEWTSRTRRQSSSRPASPGVPIWDSGSEASPREPGAGLHALELPEGVPRDPPGGTRVQEEDPLGLVDRRRMQLAVPIADLPERPRHALLHLIPLVG